MTLRWLMAKLGYVPKAELEYAQGSVRAQDEREQKAAERLGMIHMCDWPEEVADEVLYLRGKLALYETPHKNPVCVSCSKPVKLGQNYKVLFVRHEDCGKETSCDEI